jgi:hypothetical protein
MAPDKELDFKDDERPILLLRHVDVEASECIDFFLASWGAVEGVAKFRQGTGCFRLIQRQKQLFFTLEVSVESPFAEARRFRNLLHLRLFIADSREDLLGGTQEQVSRHGCSFLRFPWFSYPHASQNNINRLDGILCLYGKQGIRTKASYSRCNHFRRGTCRSIPRL